MNNIIPINQGNKCKNCKYFVQADQNGNCHLHPPTTHIVPVQTLQGNQLAVQGIFPPVDPDTFCGSFDRAIK